MSRGAQATLARERSQEVDAALARERQRCDAATAAATAAEGEVARLGGVQGERDNLRAELQVRPGRGGVGCGFGVCGMWRMGAGGGETRDAGGV